jgi:hypothetical protein
MVHSRRLDGEYQCDGGDVHLGSQHPSTPRDRLVSRLEFSHKIRVGQMGEMPWLQDDEELVEVSWHVVKSIPARFQLQGTAGVPEATSMRIQLV